jgi:hypothetical protein
VNADSMARIHACLAVCEGISTEVLELNATAGGVATLERQRDEFLAALTDLLTPSTEASPAKWHAAKKTGHDLIKKFKGGADFPPLTTTGAAHEGAINATSFIHRLLESATGQRFTSVSKGGAYERLGGIRGAGSLKGLSGIAYMDDKGSLFIREPECFTKRVVLIKPEGGAL